MDFTRFEGFARSAASAFSLAQFFKSIKIRLINPAHPLIPESQSRLGGWPLMRAPPFQTLPRATGLSAPSLSLPIVFNSVNNHVHRPNHLISGPLSAAIPAAGLHQIEASDPFQKKQPRCKTSKAATSDCLQVFSFLFMNHCSTIAETFNVPNAYSSNIFWNIRVTSACACDDAPCT